MKNINWQFIEQIFRSATYTIAFVFGSLPGGLGQQFRAQSQYILDLMIGSKTDHHGHNKPVLSLAYYD